MKKTIFLILGILPIVLLVVIAFAGRILSLYQNIPVEKIQFVDRFNSPYTDEFTFSLGQGTTKPTSILIYPELATNKNVTYSSSDESICTIDENGVITGVHYGYATVMATTEDGGKIAKMHVKIKADIPFSVTLSHERVSMIEGEILQLEAVVDAPVAVDKSLRFESSDTSIVRVDATGKLMAISSGQATITVTTVSGGITDTCIVDVVKGVLPISFDFTNLVGIGNVNQIYESSLKSINLLTYLKVIPEINKDDVIIKIQSGTGATLENGVITFERSYRLITIRAYVGDEANPQYMTEFKFIYVGD